MTRHDWINMVMALAPERRWPVVLHILTDECVFPDDASSAESSAPPRVPLAALPGPPKCHGDGRWRVYHSDTGQTFRFKTRQEREDWIAVWAADRLGDFARSAGRESIEAMKEAA